VGVAYVTLQNPALKGRIAYLPAVTSKVNDMFIKKNNTANIKCKKLKVYNDV